MLRWVFEIVDRHFERGAMDDGYGVDLDVVRASSDDDGGVSRRVSLLERRRRAKKGTTSASADPDVPRVDQHVLDRSKRGGRRGMAELRGLSFWSWDKRVDEHPPGRAYGVDIRTKKNKRDQQEQEGGAPKPGHSSPTGKSHHKEDRAKAKKRNGRRKSEADKLRVWAWDPLVDKYPPGSAYSAQKLSNGMEQQVRSEEGTPPESEDELPLNRLVELMPGKTKEDAGTTGRDGIQAVDEKRVESGDNIAVSRKERLAAPQIFAQDENGRKEQQNNFRGNIAENLGGKDGCATRDEHAPLGQEVSYASISPSRGEKGIILPPKTDECMAPPPIEVSDSEEEIPLRAVLEQFREREVAPSPAQRVIFEDTGVDIDNVNDAMQQHPTIQLENENENNPGPSVGKQHSLHRRRHLILDDSEPQTLGSSLPGEGQVQSLSAGQVQVIQDSDSQCTCVEDGKKPGSPRTSTSQSNKVSKENSSTSSEAGELHNTRPPRRQNVHFISGDPTRGVNEVYTSAHMHRLGSFQTPWELNVDGCDRYGERIYDDVDGLTCHQCRQKTLARVTICRRCGIEAHQFCGDCLWRRYGENLDEALEDPTWHCPICRDICNCSLCRAHKGWPSTGQLYRKAMRMGYASVAHYLVLTRMEPVDPNAAPVAVQLPEIDSWRRRRRRPYSKRRQRNARGRLEGHADADRALDSLESAETCEEENEEDLHFLRSDEEDLSEHSASSLERTRRRTLGTDHSNRSPDWKDTLQMLRRQSAKEAPSGEVATSSGEYSLGGDDLGSDESEEDDFIRGDGDDISEHSDKSHDRTRGPKLKLCGSGPSSCLDPAVLPSKRRRRAVAKLPFSGTSIPELMRQHNFERLSSAVNVPEQGERSDSSGAVLLTRIQHRSRRRKSAGGPREASIKDVRTESCPDSMRNLARARSHKSNRKAVPTRMVLPTDMQDTAGPTLQKRAREQSRRRRRKRQLHLDDFLATDNDFVGCFSDEAEQENLAGRNTQEPPTHTETLASFATRKPKPNTKSHRAQNNAPPLIIETNFLEASIKHVISKTQRMVSGSMTTAYSVLTTRDTLDWLLAQTLCEGHGEELPQTAKPGTMPNPTSKEQAVDATRQQRIHGNIELDPTSCMQEDALATAPLCSQSHAMDTRKGTAGMDSPEQLLQMYRNWSHYDKEKLLSTLLVEFEHHSASLNSQVHTLLLPPIEIALWNDVLKHFSTLEKFWCRIDAALVEREAQQQSNGVFTSLQCVEFQWEVVFFLASLIRTAGEESREDCSTERNWSVVQRLLKASVDCGSPRSRHSELEILLTHRCRQLSKYWGSDTMNLLLLWDILQSHASTPSGCRCCAVDAVSWPTNASIALEELSHMDQVFLDQRSPCGIFFQMLRDHLALKRGSSLLREASKWMALFPKTPSIVHSVVPRLTRTSSNLGHMTPASLQHYAQLVILLHHFLPRGQGRKLLKIFQGLIFFQHSSPRACRNALKGLCAFGMVFLGGLAAGNLSNLDQEICMDINNVVTKWMGEFHKMLDAAKVDGSYESTNVVASLASAIAPAWSLAACLNMKLNGSGFGDTIWRALREQCFELSLHAHVRQIPLRCLACLYSEPLSTIVAPALTSGSLEQSLSLWVIGASDELNTVALSAADAMRRMPPFGNYFLGMSFASSRSLQVSLEGRIDCARSIFTPLGMKPGLAMNIVELLGPLPKVMSRGITEAMLCKVPFGMCGVLAGLLLKYCSKPLMSTTEGIFLTRGLLSFLKLLHTKHFQKASKEVFSALPSVFDAVCEGGLADGSRLQVLLDAVFGILESASIRPASFTWSGERVVLEAANDLKELASMISRTQAIHEAVVLSIVPWFLQAQCNAGTAKVGVPSVLLLLKELLFAWSPCEADPPVAGVRQWGVPSSFSAGGLVGKTAADLFQSVMLPLLMLLEDFEANDIKEPLSTVQARVSVFELVGVILEKASQSHAGRWVPVVSESSIHSKLWSCFLEFVGRMAVQTLLSTAVRKSCGHIAFAAASSDRLAAQRGRLREERARWEAAKEKGSDILRKLGAQVPASLDRALLPSGFLLSALERYHKAMLKRISLESDPWENAKIRKAALVESSVFYLNRLAVQGPFGRGLVTHWLSLLVAGAEVDVTIAPHVQSLRHSVGQCRSGPLWS